MDSLPGHADPGVLECSTCNRVPGRWAGTFAPFYREHQEAQNLFPAEGHEDKTLLK